MTGQGSTASSADRREPCFLGGNRSVQVLGEELNVILEPTRAGPRRPEASRGRSVLAWREEWRFEKYYGGNYMGCPVPGCPADAGRRQGWCGQSYGPVSTTIATVSPIEKHSDKLKEEVKRNTGAGRGKLAKGIRKS
ncbi:hypothetical protein E2C01_044381 [Portunus trituberculatus]|uniref:Uncharacterized protein n=1 Tax=Portunus trituberculatus TaxID=210409 RepID=A0A5B7FVG3_PORTR|nr:hypothetical protein [Portunus trituberculatus]